MKLFNLLPTERQALKQFLLWHVGYVLYVAVFFLVLYGRGWFKSTWFLKEAVIFNVLAPIHTMVFVLISPFRRRWIEAAVNMYHTLDGEFLFLAMAGLVALFGVYLYSLAIWLVGAMIPTILYS